MNKLRFVALGLTEEQAVKAAAASAEELKGFIPKARFDEVNKARKKAESDLQDRDKQLEDLVKSSGDVETLKKQMETLQGESKLAKNKYEAEAITLKLGIALKLALAGKVHDLDIVAGLLDKTKIMLDDNGNIQSGLDDQIKALQTSKAFLFIPEEKGGRPFQFKGVKPQEGGGRGRI